MDIQKTLSLLLDNHKQDQENLAKIIANAPSLSQFNDMSEGYALEALRLSIELSRKLIELTSLMERESWEKA